MLNFYTVAVKGQPAQIRIFEMYADTAAYRRMSRRRIS